MENSKRHIITREYANSLISMITSVNPDDANLALGILDNRDTDNKESEENYKSVISSIMYRSLLPPNKTWVAEYDGRVITINKKSYFRCEEEVLRNLSLHCTGVIGKAENNNVRYYKGITGHLKKVFKGGRQLRDYLVKNNIVTIKQIQY